MAVDIRRVVTGHDANGRARVLFDGHPTRQIKFREGCETALLWTSRGFPADNDGDEDAALQSVPTSLADGAVFRVIDYAPGVAPRNHRTLSVDFAAVLEGKITMELDDGEAVELRAGDVLVQRGTIHNWVNHGPDKCRIVFALIGAKPVRAPGGPLPAEG